MLPGVSGVTAEPGEADSVTVAGVCPPKSPPTVEPAANENANHAAAAPVAASSASATVIVAPCGVLCRGACV